MTKLITAFGNTTSGFPLINADAIVRLKPVKTADGLVYDAYAANNELLGRISQADADRLDGAQAVPDTTGTVAIQFWHNTDDDVIEDDRYPVVAWLVRGDWAEPVLCEAPSIGIVCLELREKGDPYAWVFPEEANCKTLADAREYAKDELARREKQRQRRYEETRAEWAAKQAGGANQ